MHNRQEHSVDKLLVAEHNRLLAVDIRHKVIRPLDHRPFLDRHPSVRRKWVVLSSVVQSIDDTPEVVCLGEPADSDAQVLGNHDNHCIPVAVVAAEVVEGVSDLPLEALLVEVFASLGPASLVLAVWETLLVWHARDLISVAVVSFSWFLH